MGSQPKLFELSGENEELAAAEVAAAAEAKDLEFEELRRSPGALIAETGPAERFAGLGLTHRVLRLLATLDDAGDFEPEIDLDATFSVRASRVRDSRRDLSLPDVEREIGSVLERAGGEVDLENPERRFRAVLSGDSILVGETLLEVDRSFAELRPHQRPFFRPGVVEPVTARAMVNLARSRGTVLNPMCGTGSLMAQAAAIGAEPVGLDADREAAAGSLSNLRHEDLPGVAVVGDGRALPFPDATFDAAVADLPYGRSTRLYGEDLYRRAAREMERVLKEGCYMVIAAPGPLEGAEERFEQRVHRSLTRHLNVFRK